MAKKPVVKIFDPKKTLRKPQMQANIQYREYYHKKDIW